MEPSDEEIVARVLAGATQEYAWLVRKYERPIYNLMYRVTAHEQEAADLAQEVFVQSFAKLQTLDNHQPYFNWLYTIALNKGRDWKRALRNRSHHTPWRETDHAPRKDHFQDLSSQEQAIQQQQYQEQLQRALLTLPAEKREPLILRYSYELSIREIAEIFSLSESATKMRIKRSLEQLRSLVENPFNQVSPHEQ